MKKSTLLLCLLAAIGLTACDPRPPSANQIERRKIGRAHV